MYGFDTSGCDQATNMTLPRALLRLRHLPPAHLLLSLLLLLLLLQERNLCSSLVELVGSLMRSHPAEFLGGPAIESALGFAEGLLGPNACNDDKAVGLFVCCDILQHLKVLV